MLLLEFKTRNKKKKTKRNKTKELVKPTPVDEIEEIKEQRNFSRLKF